MEVIPTCSQVWRQSAKPYASGAPQLYPTPRLSPEKEDNEVEEEQNPLDTSRFPSEAGRRHQKSQVTVCVTTGPASSQIRLGRCNHYHTICWEKRREKTFLNGLFPRPKPPPPTTLLPALPRPKAAPGSAEGVSPPEPDFRITHPSWDFTTAFVPLGFLILGYFALTIIILLLEVGRWKWLEETSGLIPVTSCVRRWSLLKLITPSGPFLGGQNLSSLVKKQTLFQLKWEFTYPSEENIPGFGFLRQK